MSVTIIAIGQFLPGQPVSNSKLYQVLGLNETWIERMIGTTSRYFAVDLDTKQRTFSLADMGEAAARQALEYAGMKARDVDVAVMSTATPDHLMPATINLILDRLGIDGIPSFQVQAGCAGAIQALELAMALLGEERRTALVIGADSCQKHFDLDADPRAMKASELINLALFGDGAGAAVLRAGKDIRGLRVERVFSRCEGLGREPGQFIHWFGTQTCMAAEGPSPRRVPNACEDYTSIAAEVPRMSHEVLDELLSGTAWTRDQVRYYCPPQLTGRMTASICDELEIPAQMEISCVAQSGNNGNALPFMQLGQLKRVAQTDDRALLIAIESSKWLKAGLALTAV